ncbi:alpha/beta fold hydrolase [Glutamicibacter sp. X7]
MSIGGAPVLQRGSGIPVVMVHGNGVDHRCLLPLDPAFAQPGVFRRVYVDLPGFGQTPALTDRGGLPQLADWLEGTVREVVGTEPFAIVGQSMGGLLATEIADRLPGQVLGVGLCAPVVYPQAERRTLPERCILHSEPRLLASLSAADAENYAEMSVVQSEANYQRFERFVLPGIRVANVRAMAKLAREYTLPRLPVEGAGQWPHGVIITGRQDHVVGYQNQRRLRDRFATVELVELDRAGHNVHIDRPRRVLAAMRNFAAAVAAEAKETGQ